MLPEMMLRSAAVVPPMVLPLELLMRTPQPSLGRAAPEALKPIVLPATRLPLALMSSTTPRIRCPLPCPLIRLPRRVLLSESTTTPCQVLPRSALPEAVVPMPLPMIVLLVDVPEVTMPTLVLPDTRLRLLTSVPPIVLLLLLNRLMPM